MPVGAPEFAICRARHVRQRKPSRRRGACACAQESQCTHEGYYTGNGHQLGAPPRVCHRDWAAGIQLCALWIDQVTGGQGRGQSAEELVPRFSDDVLGLEGY